MRRSQVAQAYSTTYHPQANGLVEKQKWTMLSMLKVLSSRYMTDGDRYLPQMMIAYNSTQHYTTELGPHMKLTRPENYLPLFFFYPQFDETKHRHKSMSGM